MLQIWSLYDFYFLVCPYIVAKPYVVFCVFYARKKVLLLARLAIAILSVLLSVCPSVRPSVKTVADRHGHAAYHDKH